LGPKRVQRRATMATMDSTVAEVAGGEDWLTAVKEPMKGKPLRTIAAAFNHSLYSTVLIEGNDHFDEAQVELVAAIDEASPEGKGNDDPASPVRDERQLGSESTPASVPLSGREEDAPMTSDDLIARKIHHADAFPDDIRTAVDATRPSALAIPEGSLGALDAEVRYGYFAAHVQRKCASGGRATVSDGPWEHAEAKSYMAAVLRAMHSELDLAYRDDVYANAEMGLDHALLSVLVGGAAQLFGLYNAGNQQLEFDGAVGRRPDWVVGGDFRAEAAAKRWTTEVEAPETAVAAGKTKLATEWSKLCVTKRQLFASLFVLELQPIEAAKSDDKFKAIYHAAVLLLALEDVPDGVFETLETPRVTFAANVRGRSWEAFAVWWADDAHEHVHWREVTRGVLGTGDDAEGLVALPTFLHAVFHRTRVLVDAVVAESGRRGGRRPPRERRFTGLPPPDSAAGGAGGGGGAGASVRSTHHKKAAAACFLKRYADESSFDNEASALRVLHALGRREPQFQGRRHLVEALHLCRDELYIVLTYVPKVPWHEAIERHCGAEQFVYGALVALSGLHHAGILHADISTNNVIWDTRRRTTRVVDFDLSVCTGRDLLASPHSLSMELGGRGTAGFMAPEVCARAACSAQVDVFALGVVGVKVLFRIRGDPTEVVHRVQSDKLGGAHLQDSASGSGGRDALLDLLRLMLLPSPSRRITVQRALQHPAFGARRAASGTPRRTRRSSTSEESKKSPDTWE